MADISTAEKIETIVFAYLGWRRTTSGAYGTLVDVPAFPALGVASCYRVEADGKTFIVRCVAGGWSVSFGPMTCIDRDLIEAARLALDGRGGRDVGSVSQSLGLVA